MCSMCLKTPCHPRCPNAPEPVAVYSCCKCGEGIFGGEKYLDSSEGKICEDCLDDMTADEWLELFGESLAIAEKEEM